MADLRALQALLERIDQDVHRHEQLQQWDAPPLDGPIYEAQVERARLAGLTTAQAADNPRAPVAQAPVTLADGPRTFANVEDFIANRQPGDVYRLPDVAPEPRSEPKPEPAARTPWWQFWRWPNV